MLGCCATRDKEEGDDGLERCGNQNGFFSGFQLKPDGRSAGSKQTHETGDQEAEEQRSAETVQRHINALGGEPNLLLYMVGPTAEDLKFKGTRGTSSTSEGKQQARHIPPNTVEGVPVETENFVGKALVMYKPAGGLDRGHNGSKHPYYQYFAKRKRNWEVRVQGRFKRIPKGDLHMGIVLRDFNYDQAVARHSIIVKTAGMSLVKYETYLSWGDRCAESKKPDAELSHLVTNMTAWDQIIVTPQGKPIPLLNGELNGIQSAYGLNLERKEMGLAEYNRAINNIYSEINTKDTYTMCFWGASMFIDLLNWKFKIGTSIAMARFFEDDPIHVALYELGPAAEGQDPTKHLESRKRYYVDFMFWSNCVQCPRLPARYVFLDAPEELERFSSAHCSADGEFETACSSQGGQPEVNAPCTASSSSSSRSAFLASWTNKLKWIPTTICAVDTSGQDQHGKQRFPSK